MSKRETFFDKFKKEEKTPKNQSLEEQLNQIKEEIGITLKNMVDANFPPIITRLERIEQLLTAVIEKVDLSAYEKEVLDLIKQEVSKK